MTLSKSLYPGIFSLKMFYAPKGDARAYPEEVQLFYLYIILFRKCIRHFQNHNTAVTFFYLKMFILRTGGRGRSKWSFNFFHFVMY